MNPRHVRLFELLVIGALVSLLICEVAIYSPATEGAINGQVQLSLEGQTVVVTNRLTSTFAATVNEVSYIVANLSVVKQVTVYFDAAYPFSYGTPTDTYGLSQHLADVLNARHLSIPVDVLNASELRAYLLAPVAPGSVLIMGSGVFPYTVFSTTQNVVSPWIARGGILIWLGDKIGYYSGKPGGVLTYPSSSNPGFVGVDQFINESWFSNFPDGTTDNVSLLAGDLSVSYPVAFHDDELSLDVADTHGGIDIGNDESGYTTVSAWPYGAGRIVYFSGPIDDDTTMSIDVANILQSQVADLDFKLLGERTVVLSSGQTSSLTDEFEVAPFEDQPTSYQVCDFEVETDYLAVFASNGCIPLP